VKKVTHEHIVLLLANEMKTIASMNKQSYEEALQERGSAVQRERMILSHLLCPFCICT
jgi:hypothetical protein